MYNSHSLISQFIRYPTKVEIGKNNIISTETILIRLAGSPSKPGFAATNNSPIQIKNANAKVFFCARASMNEKSDKYSIYIPSPGVSKSPENIFTLNLNLEPLAIVGANKVVNERA